MSNKIDMKVLKNEKSKGFQEITLKLDKAKEKPIHLSELKKYMTNFDEELKKKKEKNINYWIIGRNKYGIKTIKSKGNYYDDYDEGEDYLNKKSYDKNTYDTFEYVEIIMNIDKPNANEAFMFGNK